MHISGPLHKWREEVGRRYLNLDFKPATEDPVSVSLELNFACDGLRLGRLRHSAGVTFRDREIIQQDNDDCFSLLIPRAGLLNVGHQSHSLEVGAHNATVVHNCQPGYVGASKTCDFTALVIPEQKLKQLGVDGMELVGSTWRRSNGAFQLLKSYMSCIEKTPVPLSEAVMSATAGHIAELAALAARDALELTNSLRDEFLSVREARLQTALKHINDNIRNPGLCVSSVAASQGVSARYMHALFEAAGMQYSSYVNERRLQRAYSALLDPANGALTIADIAFASGFSDISHFNRLFRRRFELSPSAARSKTKG